jgi:N-acyl-D-amino-acid deacylase
MPMQRHASPFVATLLLTIAGCGTAPPQSSIERYDLLIRNGLVYDGSGAPPRRIDIAVRGDRVAALLPAGAKVEASQVLNAHGKAVAPGFINVLSWATESLIVDGRGLSDTKQGVTLEIFGEGGSMGPLNPAMKVEAMRQQGDIKYPIEWTTLGEYLDYLQQRGITPNIASFVGATTVRMHELGEGDAQPSAPQLARMQEDVRQAMREGALGVGASLIYAPASYAKTDELHALAQAAAESGGGYVAHMRSEANGLEAALEETLDIARATAQHTEVYHLKAAGERNWPKMAQAIARIEAARREGLDVAANMYADTAGATGLDASIPPWVQAGGRDALNQRLRDPLMRRRVIAEMRNPDAGWENLRLQAGSPERVLFIGFKSDKLKPLIG